MLRAKRILDKLAISTAVLVATCAPVHAGPIPYPNLGTQNPVNYTFTASANGDVVAYYGGYAGAAYHEVLGLLVNGVDTGIYGLENHTTPAGGSLDFGAVKAGDSLTFVVHVFNPELGFEYSDKSLNGVFDGFGGGPGLNHIYSTDYTAGGVLDPSIPSGIYVGFEDLPSYQNPDYNYTDLQFVFTNVKATNDAPEPTSMAILGISLAGVAGYRLRRRKVAA